MQLDEDVIAARRESTKTILRVPWTTEQPASKEAGSVSEAASVAPATPVAAVDPSADELKELDGTVKTSQASSATQAKERLLSERRKSPSPAQSKPKALPQNEFVTMALKAGALKQSSPLVMSEMAGNKGFDPLGFAKDKGLLLQYREAELLGLVRHEVSRRQLEDGVVQFHLQQLCVLGILLERTVHPKEPIQ